MNYEKLEKTVMFKIQESDKNDIEILKNSISKVKEIDTTGIEAIVFPFEEKREYLRDDSDSYCTNKDEVLNNAQNDGQYVTICKVVK